MRCRAAAALGLLLAACMPPYRATAVRPEGRTCPSQAAAWLSWHFPATASDQRDLDAWCRAVGPPVVDSVPSASFGPVREGDSLAVVVFNADAGAADVLALLRDELHLDCAGSAAVRGSGSPPFVLLLQEALRRSVDIPDVPKGWATPPPVGERPRPGPRLDVVEVARRCGLAFVYVPGARNGYAPRDGLREDKGVAILASVPLSDFVAIELPYEAARRVVVGATVHSARGDSLRVASVYLISTPPPWRVLRTGNSSRTRQALALVDALGRLELARAGRSSDEAACPAPCRPAAPEGHAIATLAAGDFNFWSTKETAFSRLLEYFPDSPPRLAVPTRGPYPTDHVFFRRAGVGGTAPRASIPTSYRRLGNRYYSDHYPVIAWVRLAAGDQ